MFNKMDVKYSKTDEYWTYNKAFLNKVDIDSI